MRKFDSLEQLISSGWLDGSPLIITPNYEGPYVKGKIVDGTFIIYDVEGDGPWVERISDASSSFARAEGIRTTDYALVEDIDCIMKMAERFSTDKGCVIRRISDNDSVLLDVK